MGKERFFLRLRVYSKVPLSFDFMSNTECTNDGSQVFKGLETPLNWSQRGFQPSPEIAR